MFVKGKGKDTGKKEVLRKRKEGGKEGVWGIK